MAKTIKFCVALERFVTAPLTINGIPMSDQNLEQSQAPADNLNPEAVQEAPESGELLAGKFKSKEALLDSVSSLVEKVEGRSLKPSEVLELSGRDVKDLEGAYLGLERQFHKAEPTSEPNGDDEAAQAEAYLNDWAKKNGFVRKQDLDAEQIEKQQLEAYFAQNPSAKGREELIKKFAQTPDFQNKSFAEVDQYLTGFLGDTSQPKETRQVKMGQPSISQPEKTLDNMSDEDWHEYLNSGNGAAPVVRANPY